ncbi:hypothetical protein D4764_15G0006890 [Takifugu flavidus]|uniref:Uncharacterized protein n=1 Tax=Takifugu flavidus TaxID=433684 RepID=A0A5C6P1V0_9TELE|nr:hypothetical protein D4764_15G0006890 [Takifugu flavidus]
MDEAIGGRPSIRPPCLIASAWGEGHSTSGSSHSVPERPDGESGTEEEQPGPAPRKRQRRDRVLELLERAEERATREEARDERLLDLLEKLLFFFAHGGLIPSGMQPARLCQKCDKLGRQLFYAEQHNRDLNDKLQQAKELNKKKDEEKASLQQQLDLRKGFNQKGEIQEKLNGVDEQPKKVDVGLQINIPLNDINDSQELQNSEGSLEEEVGQPREVLPEREEQFREKSLRNEAHVDTLALLTQTEAALRESEEKSSRLEKELQEIVSEQGEKQLSRKEESVSMEPCGPDNQAINQLYDLCDHWENIINQMMETERSTGGKKVTEAGGDQTPAGDSTSPCEEGPASGGRLTPGPDTVHLRLDYWSLKQDFGDNFQYIELKNS